MTRAALLLRHRPEPLPAAAGAAGRAARPRSTRPATCGTSGSAAGRCAGGGTRPCATATGAPCPGVIADERIEETADCVPRPLHQHAPAGRHPLRLAGGRSSATPTARHVRVRRRGEDRRSGGTGSASASCTRSASVPGRRRRWITRTARRRTPTFPRLIAPQNPFHELRRAVARGRAGRVGRAGRSTATCSRRRTSGTGSTPRSRRSARRCGCRSRSRCRPATRVRQAVTLTIRGDRAGEPAPSAEPADVRPSARVDGATLPADRAVRGRATASRSTARESRTRSGCCGRPTCGSSSTWRPTAAPSRLRRAADEAAALGAGLELAVTVSDDGGDETARLIRGLARRSTRRSSAVLVVPRPRVGDAGADRSAPVVEALARCDAAMPLFVGHDGELHRTEPRPAAGRACSTASATRSSRRSTPSTTPRWSRRAPPSPTRCESARAFCGDLPLAVTPITLRKRVNPYATGPAPPVPPGELPPPVDPRQMSLFGAGWTLGGLKYLAESGVASVTFYETTGWLGVMEREAGCPLPDKFPSRPGMVFPLFHVLADANEFAGGRRAAGACRPTRCAFDGLALRRGDTTPRDAGEPDRPSRRRSTVARPRPRGVACRMLDETTFDRATPPTRSGSATDPANRGSTGGRHARR